MSRPPVDYIERTREQYAAVGYPPYRWVHNEDEPPFAPVSRPLAESRIGLIASGGIYRAGQIAFHYRDDISYRIIPRDCEMSELRATHFAYDVTDARTDPNVVFPLERLREEARDGGSARSPRTPARSWAASTRRARYVNASPPRSPSAWRKMRPTRCCWYRPDRCAISPWD